MVVHGVIGGALLMADPGCMLYRAHVGGKAPDSADWKGKEGYVDGTMDAESYNLISGPYLSALLANLISVTSPTYPEGARLGSGAGS